MGLEKTRQERIQDKRRLQEIEKEIGVLQEKSRT
jgi:hypothetical protein